MELSTFEASNKYGTSTRHLRTLLASGAIKGRQARISSRTVVWLIEERSLQKYLRKEHKPGPKPR